MTREERELAIDIFEDNFTVIDTHGHYTEEEECLAIDMAIEALEHKTEWIPVSERLPEDDDLYLITFDNGEIDLVAFDRGDFSYSGVIAWMPLPQPYEPKGVNE